MSALYWFAFVVGAGLLALSLFGDILGDVDGLDVDVDVDVDADSHVGDGFAILSTRNLTYFLFGFGATGVLLGWVGTGGIMTAAVATFVGLTAGAISAAAFGWLGRTESGQLLDDAGWAGRSGRVIVPLSAVGTGKITVERGGRSHELLARPFGDLEANPHNWATVLIVEMDDGVALVTPEPGAVPPTEERRRITPKTE
jgi:hypothetical protein